MPGEFSQQSDHGLEAHGKNKVKEEWAAEWSINADESGLRRKDVVRGQRKWKSWGTSALFSTPGIVPLAALVGCYGILGKMRRTFCRKLAGKGVKVAIVCEA